MFNRVLLVGDAIGIPELLDTIESKRIVGIVTASTRSPLPPILQERIKQLNIPILVQPTYNSADYPHFYASVRKLTPDCLICHSYAMLIREDILKLVEFNAFNLHAAYLPYNRGPNPIQWAIIRGDTFTGVTLHRMDRGFDTGNIIAQYKEPIYPEDTWVSLSARLATCTSKLIEQELPKLIQGNFQERAQTDIPSYKNTRLTPESPRICFDTMSNIDIYNLIRAQVKPLQGAYVMNGEKTKRFDSLIPLEEIEELRNTLCYS